MKVLVIQSCLTLCHLMDCSLPGSSIHGIFQAIKQLRKSIKTIEKNRSLQLEYLIIKLVFSFLWLLPENFAMHYKLEIGSSGEKKKKWKVLIIDASNNDFEYVHVC